MVHRHMMEAVDCTFQDILGSDKPFGGVPFVFGGDFQQILPVIPGSSRGQTVGACIQCSMLWGSITVIQLCQNMQLNTQIQAERDFAKWQLEAGQGKHTSFEGSIIKVPDHMKCMEKNTVDCLLDTIYPGIRNGNLSANYFSEHTILFSLNVDVDSLNKSVLSKFPGPSRVFHSADFIPGSEQSGGRGSHAELPNGGSI